MSVSANHLRKRKRDICHRCQRPKPTTCICSALPDKPISLSKSRVIVLQHPHEQRRKNRSLPIIELCFDGQGGVKQNEVITNDETTTTHNNNNDEQYSSSSSLSMIGPDFHCIVAKRLGDKINSNLMNLIKDPNHHLLLVYPSDDAIPLKEALKTIRHQKSNNSNDMKHSHNDDDNAHCNKDTNKITLFFIDATWKYAKEMEKACTSNGVWPSHIVRVKLTKDDLIASSFQPRRFDIRAPPTEDHLSTAECIGHVLRYVEDREDIFTSLMKPLDLMVSQWHSFFENKKAKKTAKLKNSDDSA